MMAEEKEDRISKLPKEIIHHILSFLPTEDVVHTCLLSKYWKFMWYSVPKLYFTTKTNRFRVQEGLQKFYNYVDNCLEHRNRGIYFLVYGSNITSFKIWMNSYERSESGRVDKWLAFAVKNKANEINLRLDKDKDLYGQLHYYRLPKTLVVNAKYLTTLRLSRVELDSPYSFNFPSLKSLSLNFVQIKHHDVVDKLLLGSPSLEELRMVYCYLSTNYELRILSSSLKYLEITLTDQIRFIVKKIMIEAINLEYLELNGVCFEKLDLSQCKAITYLSLTCDWGLSEESSSFESLISNLPLLENLSLCNELGLNLNRISISSQTLKNLNLNNYNYRDELVTVIIKSAPKLSSFFYQGDVNVSILMDSSSHNSLHGTFCICNYLLKYESIWFIKLMNFLLNINCCWSMLTLKIRTEKALIIPEDLKRICRSPLVNWEHLKVIIITKLDRELDLRDTIRWISPSLKTLSIVGGTEKAF
ncbi:hypothetical protein CsatB_018469 [Cannabis sativa]